MINKIKDIPDGTEVWVKMKREVSEYDDETMLKFNCGNGACNYLNDENEVLTEEQMRDRFSVNDGMPKQGDKVEVRYIGWDDDSWTCEPNYFVGLYKNQVVVERKDGNILRYDQWRFPPKKIQKTLAELEKELGYDEGTLEITN